MAHEIQTMLAAEPLTESSTPSTTMTWAKEVETGEARYIGEIGKERRGYKCDCVCFGCGYPLSARKAGAPPIQWSGNRQQRPHFAHQRGAIVANCQIITARIAALNVLRSDGIIQLPGRGRSGYFVGLSGTRYEAFVESPPEKAIINTVAIHDTDTAILTLVGGRQIKVKLVSSITADNEVADSSGFPTILLLTDDPDIAGMSPTQIRQRLAVGVHWCQFGDDDPLLFSAQMDAQDKAKTALDWYDFKQLDPTIPDELRYETLLHLKAKEILGSSPILNLPPPSATAYATLRDGSALTETQTLPSMQLSILSATLEKRIGQLRPDLLITFPVSKTFDTGQLLIEVTVSNSIDPARRERIAALGLPALEINLSRFAGTLTLEAFTDLLIHRLETKTWIYHPHLQMLQDRAQEQLTKKVADAEKSSVQETAHQKIKQLSPAELLSKLLLAVVAYAEAVAKTRTIYNKKQNSAAIWKEEHTREVLYIYVNEFKSRGYAEFNAFWDARFQAILNRILSLKLDRAIGYNLNSAWQVINTMLMDQAQSRSFHSIYLLAIRLYKPTVNHIQQERITAWRDEVAGEIKSPASNYSPDCRYNLLIARLFPELKDGLSKLSKIEAENSAARPHIAPPVKVKKEVISPDAYSRASGNIKHLMPVFEERVPNLGGVHEGARRAANNGQSPLSFIYEYAHEKGFEEHDVMNALRELDVMDSPQRWKQKLWR
ncbi:hypothetical protein FNU76_02390 [Chitinimonas arctica]|uniref:Uncharacterized protein n=1 Tax=Chitinimonas arctica TaxID=2594795 RepID=A0A516SAX0_9NEIS|nr:hypothetical protein [Chitinimonas arctica]QDQ25293.1 hypothetical protein FNU76_02390 [Chitinimonas arctica]